MRPAGDRAAREEDALVAHGADGAQQRQRVEVEDRLGARLVADAGAVAGQAEHVAHAHGGGAEHVALDGDAVPVAAGDLVDRAVAGAGQQRADADRGHVAVGAGGVGGVDRVADLGERAGGLEDVGGVGAVGRVELGGHRELAGAERAFEPAAGGHARRRLLVGADVVAGEVGHGPGSLGAGGLFGERARRRARWRGPSGRRGRAWCGRRRALRAAPPPFRG